MSSPAAASSSPEHQRNKLPPTMMFRQNLRDGRKWSLPMSEPPESQAVMDGGGIGNVLSHIGPMMTTNKNGDTASVVEANNSSLQNKKMSSSLSSSSLVNRQSTAAVTASTTFNSSCSSTRETTAAAAHSLATSHSSSSTSRITSSSTSSSQRSQTMSQSRSSNELNMKKTLGIAQRIHPGERMSHMAITGGNELNDNLTLPMTSSVPFANGSVTNTLGGNVQSTSSSSFEATSATKVKVVADGISREKVEARNLGHQKFQNNDVSFEASHSQAAVKEKLETNNFTAEKMAAVREGQYIMNKGDITQKEEHKAMAASMKLATENVTAEKTAMACQAERQFINAQGVINQETHRAAQTLAKVTVTSSKEVTSSQSQMATIMSSQMGSGMMAAVDKANWPSLMAGDDLPDLECLTAGAEMKDVENTLSKCVGVMSKFVETLRSPSVNEDETIYTLGTLGTMIRKARAVPQHGQHLGTSLVNRLRGNGGLEALINCCSSNSSSVQFTSAKVIEMCLTNENREFVIENGLENVVSAAVNCSSHQNYEHKRVGTGILEHLFKDSENTCSRLIKMGGLNAVLQDCRVNDLETSRHCARALANAALYGGYDEHQRMIKDSVPLWLYPLACSTDESVKYYACLALAILMNNKEIESNVLISGPIDHIEPYISGRNPNDFSKGSVAHVVGQSKEWLQMFVPVLNSKRKEAQSLAAFHFAVEAGIKKNQGATHIFHEIGAIEPLKKVASSPNAIASKFAAQALQIIGEEVPHKLSQQVPLWTVEDVVEWLKQIGFSDYAALFKSSKVDGDLLLQLTETMLVNDIGVSNGILRKRFMRELGNLKKMTDYSSCDQTNLNNFLRSIGLEMCQYTYSLLQAGVDQDVLRYLTEEQLEHDCNVDNSIHRLRILEAIRGNKASTYLEENSNNQLDVFVSYRRSNGSQLASLLKVLLQLRGFSVFIDIERLEAGKFDNNLLQSIRMAKNFILVLTPSALDRCVGDEDTKDWVHREIVTAIESQCKIIPIIDNFQWPEPEVLPEDMRAVCYFNGVKWIHDYQDACVEKVIRFIRGDTKAADAIKNANVNFGTPGTMTPNNRYGPIYQRSQSDESRGSDKENNHNNNLYINNFVNGNEVI